VAWIVSKEKKIVEVVVAVVVEVEVAITEVTAVPIAGTEEIITEKEIEIQDDEIVAAEIEGTVEETEEEVGGKDLGAETKKSQLVKQKNHSNISETKLINIMEYIYLTVTTSRK
jgi:hypothetical protein